MDRFIRILGVTALFIATLVSAADLVTVSPLETISQGKRALVSMSIADGASDIKLARLYFKRGADQKYNFVVFNQQEGGMFTAELPAVGDNVQVVDYKVVTQSADNSIYKSPKFSAQVVKVTGNNSALADGFIQVYSEYPEDETDKDGFEDKIRYVYNASDVSGAAALAVASGVTVAETGAALGEEDGAGSAESTEGKWKTAGMVAGGAALILALTSSSGSGGSGSGAAGSESGSGTPAENGDSPVDPADIPEQSEPPTDPFAADPNGVGTSGGSSSPTDPVDESTPTSPTGGTAPQDPTAGTTPTDPTGGTTPQDPTTGTTPTDPTGGTTPQDPTTGTTPTDPTGGTTPQDPTTGTTPTSPTGGASPQDPTTGTTPTSPTGGTTPQDPTGGTTPVCTPNFVALVNPQRGDNQITVYEVVNGYVTRSTFLDINSNECLLDAQRDTTSTVLTRLNKQARNHETFPNCARRDKPVCMEDIEVHSEWKILQSFPCKNSVAYEC